MKANIVCFSQTVSTKKVAEVMQSTINDSGHTTKAVPLRKVATVEFRKIQSHKIIKEVFYGNTEFS